MLDRIRSALRPFRRAAGPDLSLDADLLGPGTAALLGWTFLGLAAPDMAEGTRFVVAFCCWLAAIFARIGRVGTLEGAHAAALRLATFGVPVLALAFMLLWRDDPLLCQRIVTVWLLSLAIMYLMDAATGTDQSARLNWRRATAADRPRITRREILRYATCAALIETATLLLPFGAWLLVLAVMPVVLAYLRAVVAQSVAVRSS